MQWQNCIDVVLRTAIAVSGLGLVGLLVVRVTPRGRWKVVGLEFGPLLDPQNQRIGGWLAWVFGVCSALAVVRAFGIVAWGIG